MESILKYGLNGLKYSTPLSKPYGSFQMLNSSFTSAVFVAFVYALNGHLYVEFDLFVVAVNE